MSSELTTLQKDVLRVLTERPGMVLSVKYVSWYAGERDVDTKKALRSLHREGYINFQPIMLDDGKIVQGEGWFIDKEQKP